MRSPTGIRQVANVLLLGVGHLPEKHGGLAVATAVPGLLQLGVSSSATWASANCSDIKAVKARLNKLKLNYYTTKDGTLRNRLEPREFEALVTKTKITVAR